AAPGLLRRPLRVVGEGGGAVRPGDLARDVRRGPVRHGALTGRVRGTGAPCGPVGGRSAVVGGQRERLRPVRDGAVLPVVAGGVVRSLRHGPSIRLAHRDEPSPGTYGGGDPRGGRDAHRI